MSTVLQIEANSVPAHEKTRSAYASQAVLLTAEGPFRPTGKRLSPELQRLACELSELSTKPLRSCEPPKAVHPDPKAFTKNEAISCSYIRSMPRSEPNPVSSLCSKLETNPEKRTHSATP